MDSKLSIETEDELRGYVEQTDETPVLNKALELLSTMGM